MRSSLQFVLLLFLFLITLIMCAVGAGGILLLRDYDNLAVYVSLLTFVLGKWTGLTGAIFYDRSASMRNPCLSFPMLEGGDNHTTSDEESPR